MWLQNISQDKDMVDLIVSARAAYAAISDASMVDCVSPYNFVKRKKEQNLFQV